MCPPQRDKRSGGSFKHCRVPLKHPATQEFRKEPEPQSDAEEVRREIADLDAVWDSLTPAERNQRLAQIQPQLTNLDFETRNMPQDQTPGVDLIPLPSLVNLGRAAREGSGP
jgi:hypothetical protein